jgi:hypothetical protein
MPRQHENDPNMNRGEVHQISERLGALTASVELMTDMWRRQEENASAGRRALHEKFEHFRDEVGLQISGLSLRVDRMVDSMKDVDETLAKVEPAVKKYEDQKLREEGAKKLGARLWIATTTIAGVLGWGLHEFIGYLRH